LKNIFKFFLSSAGTGVSSMLACAKAGADAVDAAVDSMRFVD